MATRSIVRIVCLFGVAICVPLLVALVSPIEATQNGDPPSDSKKQTTVQEVELQKQMVKVAQQGYDESMKLFAGGKITVDMVVNWSGRLLNSQLALENDNAVRVEAAKEHVTRMANLRKIVSQKAQGGLEGVEATYYVTYCHLEAQLTRDRLANGTANK